MAFIKEVNSEMKGIPKKTVSEYLLATGYDRESRIAAAQPLFLSILPRMRVSSQELWYHDDSILINASYSANRET